MIEDTVEKLNEYDSEPVKYCTQCYSLKIKYEESIDSEYCMDCGCSDIAESPIEVWEKKYEKRYGHKFTEKSNDPRKSPIFQLSTSKLMLKVAESAKWDKIIRTIYDHFPRNLSKADSIIMFFDKIVRENKLDRLKGLLYKMKI